MKVKKTYIAFTILLAILIGCIAIYKYMYQKPRDIAQEHVDFDISPQLLNENMSDPQKATNYIDKVVLIKGTITAIEQNSVIFDNAIQINFNAENLNSFSIQDQIEIKGRCVGYDDLLELVKIDQATTIKKN